jgi:hypothetical protein
VCTTTVTTSATVVWNDIRGRIGAQFADMEPTSRKAACDWVTAQLNSKRIHKAGSLSFNHSSTELFAEIPDALLSPIVTFLPHREQERKDWTVGATPSKAP